MTDTKPVVGDVWAYDIETRTIYVVEDRVKYWMQLPSISLWASCTIDQWHAWAANARKVG